MLPKFILKRVGKFVFSEKKPNEETVQVGPNVRIMFQISRKKLVSKLLFYKNLKLKTGNWEKKFYTTVRYKL